MIGRSLMPSLLQTAAVLYSYPVVVVQLSCSSSTAATNVRAVHKIASLIFCCVFCLLRWAWRWRSCTSGVQGEQCAASDFLKIRQKRFEVETNPGVPDAFEAKNRDDVFWADRRARGVCVYLVSVYTCFCSKMDQRYMFLA